MLESLGHGAKTVGIPPWIIINKGAQIYKSQELKLLNTRYGCFFIYGNNVTFFHLWLMMNCFQNELMK